MFDSDEETRAPAENDEKHVFNLFNLSYTQMSVTDTDRDEDKKLSRNNNLNAVGRSSKKCCGSI